MKINISGKKGVDVNPDMIGLFFEDINYGADGGLYAELLENRSFDFFPTMEFGDISPLSAWDKVGEAVFTSETESPMNNINPQHAHIKGDIGEGIVNRAYEGIFCEKGKKYDFSMYVKGEAKLRIEIKTDSVLCAQGVIEAKCDEWKKYCLEMESGETVYDAKLYITFEEAGECDVDMTSLFPRDTFCGRKNGLRSDMAQALKAIKPGFIRFPGGCIVEGTVIENRYRWKDTIGPVEERKINWNRWQDGNVGVTAKDYFQSYGLGFYEYFLLCEDIGAQPLPVLNCGMACQYKTGECVPMDELDEYIQDALDLIEFANGSVDTVWGKKRAEMGHSEPFNLVYLGIGNEQWEENYFERYEAFQKVIAEKHPEIKLITSSGPFAQGKEFDKAYEWLKGKKSDFAYAVDEHYYVKSEWMFENADRYDSYERNGVKVFAGEYACHIGENQPKPNSLEAAIAEAAMMTGFERNADVVTLVSYAPLFARVNYTQWTPDMIFVNNHEIMLTPSYHVQAMFGNNVPTYTLQFEREDDSDVYISAGYRDGEYILKIANRGGKKDVVLSLPEGVEAIEEIKLTSESLSDVNTMSDKDRVSPKSLKRPVGGSREINLTVPPISFNVYKMK